MTLVCNVGPSVFHYEETFSTLLLAKRALVIKNNIKKVRVVKKRKCVDIMNDEKKIEKEKVEEEKRISLVMERKEVMGRAMRTPLRAPLGSLSNLGTCSYSNVGKKKMNCLLYNSPKMYHKNHKKEVIMKENTCNNIEEEEEEERTLKICGLGGLGGGGVVDMLRVLQSKLSVQNQKIVELEERQRQLLYSE